VTGKVSALRLGAAVLAAAALAPPASAQDTDLVAKGEYLMRAAGCLACHTDVKNDGAPFAGGRAMHTPFGTFYSPNITPDVATGIGAWSDADFVAALRHGEAPDGSNYFPVFPYPSYTGMRETDMLAIKAYLFSLDPVTAENKEHEVGFPYGIRFLQGGWKLLNFEEGPLEDDPSQSEVWNRGRYLSRALAHCGECHTPRGDTGGPVEEMYLAGTADGPDGELVPNITPHDTGIADWSESEIVTLLRDGTKPDWDNIQGSMAEAVEDGLSFLTDEDLQAIAVYIKSVPPIDNTPRRAAD
jgi:mono/diheme cytochrome c family protein